MEHFKQSIITQQGENLLANAILQDFAVQFTKIVISDYEYSEDTDFTALAVLESVKQEAVVESTEILSNTEIKVRVLLNNTEILKSYYMRQIGLYVTDGEQEILFSVTQASIAEEMPAFNEVSTTAMILDLITVISSTDHIKLVINPAGTATVADIKDISEKIAQMESKHTEDVQTIITGHQSDIQTLVTAHQRDIQTITAKHNEDINAINQEIAATKKSVSDGKTLVAAAITRKRIQTAADATFKQMADNIDLIKLGFGNARPNQVLEGVTFSTANGVELVGTIPTHGTYTTALSVVRNGDNNDIHARIPKGAYLEIVQNPNAMLPEIVLPRMDVVMAADIAPGKIRAGFNILGIEGDAWVVWTGDCSQNSDALLTGCSMWAFGNKITGTMPKHGGYTTAEMVAYANGILYARIPRGGYMDVSPGSGTNPEITMSDESVRNAIGLTSNKIMAGHNVLGVQGTATNDAVLYPDHLLEGDSGYDDGILKHGTMKNRGAYTSAKWFGATNEKINIGIELGAYITPGDRGFPEVVVNAAQFCQSIGLTPDKIKKGVTILGITGTYVGGILYDNGVVGDMAGGWDNNGYPGIGYDNYARQNATFENNRIIMSVNGRATFTAIRTSNTFNLSDYKGIRVTYNTTVYGYEPLSLGLYIIGDNGRHIVDTFVKDTNIQSGVTRYTLSADFESQENGYVSVCWSYADVGIYAPPTAKLYIYKIELIAK